MPIVFNNSKTKKERPFGRFFFLQCFYYVCYVCVDKIFIMCNEKDC